MRRNLQQTEPLQDRIAAFGRRIRAKASLLPPSKEKDDLLRRARLADMVSHLDNLDSHPATGTIVPLNK